MSKLKELYDAKVNFMAARPALERQIIEDLGDVDELITRIANLKQEKRKALAAYDLDIMTLELELGNQDVPKNKTQRTHYVRDQLRDAKHSVVNRFENELRLRHEMGDSIPELAKECGAPHLAQLYTIVKKPKSDEVEALEVATIKQAEGVEWEYVDNRGAHRYAFSTDRKVLKYYGLEEDEVVVNWPSLDYLSGSAVLIGEIEERRANMALSILDGTYEGPVFDVPNPYKEN